MEATDRLSDEKVGMERPEQAGPSPSTSLTSLGLGLLPVVTEHIVKFPSSSQIQSFCELEREEQHMQFPNGIPVDICLDNVYLIGKAEEP